MQYLVTINLWNFRHMTRKYVIALEIINSIHGDAPRRLSNIVHYTIYGKPGSDQAKKNFFGKMKIWLVQDMDMRRGKSTHNFGIKVR